MLVAIPNQVEGFIKKQKRLARMAKSNEEKAQIFGFWAGFLDGMRITGAISKTEYEKLYKEMIAFEKNKVA